MEWTVGWISNILIQLDEGAVYVGFVSLLPRLDTQIHPEFAPELSRIVDFVASDPRYRRIPVMSYCCRLAHHQHLKKMNAAWCRLGSFCFLVSCSKNTSLYSCRWTIPPETNLEFEKRPPSLAESTLPNTIFRVKRLVLGVVYKVTKLATKIDFGRWQWSPNGMYKTGCILGKPPDKVLEIWDICLYDICLDLSWYIYICVCVYILYTDKSISF